MPIKITPGPLPEDGTRIQVQSTMLAFVGGTTITGFGIGNFPVDSTVNFIITTTEPPASETRHRGTVWFERGSGALWNWHPVLLPTGVTTGSAPTDFRWVQVGGKKRSQVAFVNRPALQGELLGILSEISGGLTAIPAGSVTDSKFKTIRSIEDQHTLVFSSTNPNSSQMGRNFVIDPITVAESNLTAGSEYVSVVEWGYVDALCFGSGKYASVYGGAAPTGQSEGSSQLYAQCTSFSAAGDLCTIMGFLVGSTATDGLRTAEIFKKPSLPNLVHG